ncbi:Protein phosphatase 2C 4 [Grifola frondosa]|uniref:Protein phosphatase 2C 4 n=1 Tax=Grifola frondosa TaxID=5627 RepID=A0A1C7MRS7_GRIFR|nr:Protein phosphatase 2C 4 [Grifola frondosa]
MPLVVFSTQDDAIIDAMGDVAHWTEVRLGSVGAPRDRTVTNTARTTATRPQPTTGASPDALEVDGHTHLTPGPARVPLNNPKLIGVASSRANRRDFYAFAALSLDPDELRLTLNKSLNIDWDPSALPPALARQVLFIGIYDGHGGSTVSQFLRQELHGLFENVDKSQVPEVYAWAKELGGYFRRFRGGSSPPGSAPFPRGTRTYGSRGPCHPAFFEVDKTLSQEREARECGATASVVLLQSLDYPTTPFFTSEKLALTVAHVGDTRVLLCMTDGRVIPMTENHHAEARIEAARLRKMMGGLITDSFGEVRWMGALANTRCLGDLKFKPFGVTPEPQVRSMLLDAGPACSHITLLSDGVSSVLSDDEVADLARGAPTPRHAAQRILEFAEEMGSEDNMTALVVPLAGWGAISGPDRTRELREYRRQRMIGNERQRGRWISGIVGAVVDTL